MTIVIFHHAMGLTPGVIGVAETLRSRGFDVHTPDLYQGRVFTDLDAGVAHLQTIPVEERLARAAAALEQISPSPDGDLTLIGMSMGVIPAMVLAGHREDVRNVVAMYGFVPRQWVNPWPTAAIHVHLSERDPYDGGDLDAARAEAASGDQVELFTYAGDGHLFADPGAPEYDAAAAELAVTRINTMITKNARSSGREVL